MKSTFLFSTALLALGLCGTSAAFAAAHQVENVKTPCLILKNNKVVKRHTCIGDGYVHSNAYFGGHGWSFRSIPGYGKISVDAEGGAETEGSITINGQPATTHFRTKKQLKKISSETYYNNPRVPAYSCWQAVKNPKFEFCYIETLSF